MSKNTNDGHQTSLLVYKPDSHCQHCVQLTADGCIFVGSDVTVDDSVAAEMIANTLSTAGTPVEAERTLPRVLYTQVSSMIAVEQQKCPGAPTNSPLCHSPFPHLLRCQIQPPGFNKKPGCR